MEAVNSDHVVVLPNNKNIIAVAEQLQALTSKVVVVVATKSMPEGLSALVVYDPAGSATSNGADMADAAQAVAAGEVTRAVRSTKSDAGQINEGDWIGIVRGDGIVAIAGSLLDASQALLEHLLDESRELLTIVEGSDASRSDTDQLVTWIAAKHPQVQVEVHSGGQPLYPYLFGAE